MKTFLQAKQEFDDLYSSKQEFIANIPVNLTIWNSYKIKWKNNETNEEYYKWQFFYSLINSWLYQKDYIWCEVYFPKWNKNSAPIKFDWAIFDDVKWFDYYKSFYTKKDQESLDWLRKHLIAVIEFKKENSKDTETVYNQQLKPAMKESENNFCLWVLYDTERLYLFQKKNDLFLRLDEWFNLKWEKSSTKDLSLHLTDAYYKIPSFEQLEKQITKITIDRSKRTIDDLEIVTWVYSKQLTDWISYILKVMDKVWMKNQRWYEILIQILALKIFDEKRSQKPTRNLDFYKSDIETEKLNLLFYITKQERWNIDLWDDDVQTFVNRLRQLYNEASEEYHYILKRVDTATITWEDQSHIQVISEVVEQLQDYSFVKSHKTDLYQIVFYKFANEFSKADKWQFVTPIPLIDFLVQIVNPRSTERIIDPTVWIADFLSVSYVNSKSKLDDNNIYWVDNDEQMIMLAQLNMLLNWDWNSILKYKPDKWSITWKFGDWTNIKNDLVELKPNLHKNWDWDNWKDWTKLKKFDVVLTNPPFWDDRRFEPKTQTEKEIAEMYELWNVARNWNSIDLWVLFLENAYRILKENWRLGIIVSNSIASIDRWSKAREWLMSKMRIVALFDLPANVFADTWVNTTMIIAYKPNEKELLKLQETDYDIFVKDIKKVWYEVKTEKRVKFFNKLYKINDKTFEIEQDEEWNPLLDEDFTDIAKEFKEWCLWQEKTLQDLFIKSK